AVVAHEDIECRQLRRLALAQIGPDDVVAIDRRITRNLYLIEQRCVRRLARHLDAAAMRIIEPAVVAAAEPARFGRAVLHPGIAMRTFRADESRLAIGKAEEPEVFAEDTDLFRL